MPNRLVSYHLQANMHGSPRYLTKAKSMINVLSLEEQFEWG